MGSGKKREIWEKVIFTVQNRKTWLPMYLVMGEANFFNQYFVTRLHIRHLHEILKILICNTENFKQF